jgi:hypothetical protein
MSLLDQAKADIRSIVSNSDEFGRSMTFTNGEDTATVTGLHSKHHYIVDLDGVRANSLNAHITVSEADLEAEGYPVRNADGQVDLENHRVSVADSTGTTVQYVIRQVFPNETVGVIVCILGGFE